MTKGYYAYPSATTHGSKESHEQHPPRGRPPGRGRRMERRREERGITPMAESHDRTDRARVQGSALLAALVALAASVAIAGPAQAVPGLCEHRGADHAAQHHMTRKADSRYHVEHGELPTCGLDDDDEGSSSRHDDGGDIPHRDHPGYHCKWFRGCG